MADYNHNLPVEAYAAALRAELASVPMTREHKAAIVEELEALGARTAVENRADVEGAQAVTGPQAPSVVEATGPESPEARRARHAHDEQPDGH